MAIRRSVANDGGSELKNNAILDSIRKSTNRLAADAFKTYGADEVKKEIREAVQKSSGFKLAIDNNVDMLCETLIDAAGGTALEIGAVHVKELGNKGVGESVLQTLKMSSGTIRRHAKKQFAETVGVAISDMVAATMAEIIAEAMVSSALNQSTKALPLPE